MRSCSAAISSTICVRCAAGRSGLRPSASRLGAQPGERRAQLVAGVGREASGRGERALGGLRRRPQAREHRVERVRERAHLVGAVVLGQALVEVACAAHARGARAQALERAHGDRREGPGHETAEREREQPDEHDEPPRAPDALVDGREAGEQLQARLARAERDGQRAPVATADRHGPQAVALRQRGRARGDVAAALDDPVADRQLDERAAAREQWLALAARQPAGRSEAVGRAHEARGAVAQVAVDLVAAVALDRGQQQRARHEAPQRQRGQRRQRDPRAQAPGAPHDRSATRSSSVKCFISVLRSCCIPPEPASPSQLDLETRRGGRR